MMAKNEDDGTDEETRALMIQFARAIRNGVSKATAKRQRTGTTSRLPTPSRLPARASAARQRKRNEDYRHSG